MYSGATRARYPDADRAWWTAEDATAVLARDRCSGLSVFDIAPQVSCPLRVSVVIPTLRRPDLLSRCLRALTNQDIDPGTYEVIVVDDGPDRNTQEVVEAARAEGCGRLQIHYLASHECHGPAAARNLGWQRAAADVIAFTDDDTIPTRSWLREGLRAMRGPAVAAAGSIRVPIGTTPSDHEKNAALLGQAEFATANCFVRRSALDAIGGFDPRFRTAWREDSDLQFMLMSRGGAIASAPLAIVVHPVRPGSPFDSLAKQRNIIFDALLYKKHPTLYRMRIRRSPRWDYYAPVALLLIAALATAAGAPAAATVAILVWAAFVISLCRKRLIGTSRQPLQVLGVILTSVAIPPVSVYWRMVGGLRFRTLFF